MAEWGFLTNHARVLLHIAHDPGARLRDIAASLGITERRAHGIITDLAEAGYVITQKDGRRNRYQVQAHLPVPEPGTREPAIGEVVALFATRQRTGPGPAQASAPDGDGAGHWPAQASGPDADGAGHWRAQASAPMPTAPATRETPDLAGHQHPDIAGGSSTRPGLSRAEYFKKYIACFLGPA